MDDLIKRADAICAIENTDCEFTAKDWDELTSAIMALPSADAVHGECDHCVYKWDMRGESDDE